MSIWRRRFNILGWTNCLKLNENNSYFSVGTSSVSDYFVKLKKILSKWTERYTKENYLLMMILQKNMNKAIRKNEKKIDTGFFLKNEMQCQCNAMLTEVQGFFKLDSKLLYTEHLDFIYDIFSCRINEL